VVAKWISEKLCRMYYKYFGVSCAIPRYHRVAGPRSNFDLALFIFVESVLKNKPINTHGQFINQKFASCLADCTHVDNAIRATLWPIKD